MRRVFLYLINALLCYFSSNKNLVRQKTDLVNQWNTICPLINPDKDWYHHMLDYGIYKYLIQDEKDFSCHSTL